MANIRMRTIYVPKLVPVTLVYLNRPLKPAHRKTPESRKRIKGRRSLYLSEFFGDGLSAETLEKLVRQLQPVVENGPIGKQVVFHSRRRWLSEKEGDS